MRRAGNRRNGASQGSRRGRTLLNRAPLQAGHPPRFLTMARSPFGIRSLPVTLLATLVLSGCDLRGPETTSDRPPPIGEVGQGDLAPYGVFTPSNVGAIPRARMTGDLLRLTELTSEFPGVQYYLRYEQDGQSFYGLLEGELIHRLDGHYFGEPTPTGETVPLREVRLLPPLDPNRVSKVIGVALNTAEAGGGEFPPESHPRWFAKLPTSIAGPGDPIQVPEEAGFLNHEAELVLVIGRTARHVSVEEAPSYIWGVTAGNDLSENVWYGEAAGRGGPSRLIAKGIDGWGPVGPVIAVGLDLSELSIQHRVNGELTQEGSTADLLQGPAQLVSYLSRYMTLLPGDLIFTGTVPFLPDARRALRAGDELEVEIEGLGILRNPLVPMDGMPWEQRW